MLQIVTKSGVETKTEFGITAIYSAINFKEVYKSTTHLKTRMLYLESNVNTIRLPNVSENKQQQCNYLEI